jgi:hypothetical protein
MANPDFLTPAELIVSGMAEPFKEAERLLAERRQEQISSEIAVGQAQLAVSEANAHLSDAQQIVKGAATREGAAQRAVANAAGYIGQRIDAIVELDPHVKTVLAHVYTRDELAAQKHPQPYETAAREGLRALATLTERLQPGEPMLVLPTTQLRAVAANVANEPLIVEPATIIPRKERFRFDGRIDLAVIDGKSAYPYRAATTGIATVESFNRSYPLLTANYEEGLEHFESAASNQQWLIVGKDAISEQLERLSSGPRFLAIVAIKAAQLNVEAELSLADKNTLRGNLVDLLAHISCGVPDRSASKKIREPSQSSSNFQRVSNEVQLAEMARALDNASIRSLILAAGSEKDEMLEETTSLIKERIAGDRMSITQVGQDLESLNKLDGLLEVIYH